MLAASYIIQVHGRPPILPGNTMQKIQKNAERKTKKKSPHNRIEDALIGL